MLLTALLTCTILAGASGQYPFRIADKARFFEQTDLDYPGLADVKRAVGEACYDEAARAYVRFFDGRTDRKFLYAPEEREAMVADLRRMYPDYERAVLKRADTACAFSFPIEGTTYRYTGGDIRWRDENKEWINVLNRMGYLNDLGLAYWYTGDGKYFDVWWHILSDWIADNPVPDYPVELTGGEWSPPVQSYTAPHGPWRALETGIRTGNWMSSYFYFRDAPQFTPERKWQFLRSLMEHTRYLYDYLKRGARGNWESTVSSELILPAVMAPEWKNSADILRFARQTLSNNLAGAVNDEGFQFELTLGYHRHVGEGMARAHYFLHTLNGLPGLDPAAVAKLKKTYDIVVALKKPDNSDPRMGDQGNDFNGVRPERPKGDSSFFARGVVLFGDPVYKTLSGGFPPEDYICFGRTGYEKFRETPPAQGLALSSKYLPVSRLAVMRSGAACLDTTGSSLWCLFDNSPDGVGSHSHHDYLNIELFAFDKTLLIDPGRGVTYNDPLFTAYYRTVRAHNAVQVGDDDRRQLGKRAGSSDVRNAGWESNPLYDYAKGVLENYDGVTHERELFFVKGEYWLLRDRLAGEGSPALRQYFHLLPGRLCTDRKTKTIVSRYDGCANLCIAPVHPDDVRLAIDTGYVSSGGENLPAPIVVYSARRPLPVTFETVLFPLRRGVAAPKLRIGPAGRSGRRSGTSPGFRIRLPSRKTDYFYFPDSSGAETVANGVLAFCRTQKRTPVLMSLRGRSFRWEGFGIDFTAVADGWIRREAPGTFRYYGNAPAQRIALPYKGRQRPSRILCKGKEGSAAIPVYGQAPDNRSDGPYAVLESGSPSIHLYGLEAGEYLLHIE